METMLCTRLFKGFSSCESPVVSYCTEGRGLTVRTRSVQMCMKKVSIQNCHVLKEYSLAIRKLVKIIDGAGKRTFNLNLVCFGEQCSSLEKSRCDGCHVIQMNRKYCIRVSVMFTEDGIKLVRVCKQSLERDILIQKKENFYSFWFISVDAIITFADYITLSVSVSMAYYHWLLIFLAGFSLFTLRVCSQGKLIELRNCMSCCLSIF